MRTIALASALAAAVLAAGPASADSNRRLNVPADQWMSHTQLTEKLTAQGYTVREIESDDGAYEVKVTDKNGVRIEMDVHPATGDVLPGYDD